MFANLEKTFEKIGAEINIVFARNQSLINRSGRPTSAARLNIITKKGKELFEIAVQKDLIDKL